jgi:hypothetical protein
MKGQLVRSAARFALFHMNSSLRAAEVISRARVVSDSNPNAISTVVAWDRALNWARISASIVIQSAARRTIARKRVRRVFGKTFNSNLNMGRKRVKAENAAVIVIQRAFRRCRAKRLESIVLIQRVVRGWLGTQMCLELVKARLVKRDNSAATVIQSVCRRQKARTELSAIQQAAIQIQSTWRSRLLRARYDRIIAAIRVIQVERRAWMHRMSFQRHKIAAFLLQRVWRGFLAKRIFVQQYEAALRIQKVVRWMHRMNFQRHKIAALALQTVWRGFLAKRIFVQQYGAALRIQKVVRGCLARSEYLTKQHIGSSEKADLECARFLERVEAASARMVEQLLAGEGSSVHAGPCLARLAARAQRALGEAAASSYSPIPIPMYAQEMLQISDAQKKNPADPILGRPTHLVENSTLTSGVDLHCPTSPTNDSGIVSRKASTPVRGNKTPFAESFSRELDGGELMELRARTLRQKAVEEGIAPMKSLVSEETEELDASATTPVADRLTSSRNPQAERQGIAPEAPWQDYLQMPELNVSGEPDSVSKSIDGPLKKKKPKSPLTPLKEASGEAYDDSLFGDCKEMPSPIKKPEEGWGWTDEW